MFVALGWLGDLYRQQLPPAHPAPACSKLCLKNRHGEDIFQVCVCRVCCCAALSVEWMTAALALGGLVLLAHLRPLPTLCHLSTAPSWHGHRRLTRAPHLTPLTPAGGGQRLLGVPALPRLLRRGLHRVLQLRPLPQGGEPADSRAAFALCRFFFFWGGGGGGS